MKFHNDKIILPLGIRGLEVNLSLDQRYPVIRQGISLILTYQDKIRNSQREVSFTMGPGAKRWNEIPRNIRMCSTISRFKRNLKGFLQQN